MLFVCGDTHGGENQDMKKLGSSKFSNQFSKNVLFTFSIHKDGYNKLTPNLYSVKTFNRPKNSENWWAVNLEYNKLTNVVVLGDFGMVWTNPKEKLTDKQKKWLKVETNYLETLSNKSFQVCFLDGNHENHTMLNELPEVDFCNGKAGLAFENKNGKVFHLKRGEVYNFMGKTVLVLGGASSYDTSSRKEGYNFWKEEELSEEDKKRTLKNLKKHNFNVDYVLTHNCPSHLGKLLADEVVVPMSLPYSWQNREYERALHNKEKYLFKSKDKHALFFDELLNKYNLKFKEWHFGHFHQDRVFEKKFHLHYKNPPYKVF